MKIIAGTLPKQMEKVAPLEELSDAELSAGIALLRSKLSVGGDKPRRAVKEIGEGSNPPVNAAAIN